MTEKIPDKKIVKTPSDKIDSLKKDLQVIYRNLEKYYSMSIYYEAVGRENPNKLSTLLLSKIEYHSDVLEVGLNPGILTLEAALKFARSIGVDSSPMKVVIAENLKHIEHDKFNLLISLDNMKVNPENLLNSRFKVMNPASLEFPDKSFDFIVSDRALQDTEISVILDEMYRCLKPKAELLLNLDLNNNLTYELKRDDDETYILKLNSQTIKNWAQNKNMEILSFEITYKHPIQMIIKLIPPLKNLKFLSKFENNLIINLKK